MSQLLLSILIPTLPSRRVVYDRLLDNLLPQIEPFNDEVELITLFDNKKICIGTKRNELLRLANGRYIMFLDDDDLISEDYVKLILDEIKKGNNPDVITFNSLCYENDNPPFKCHYSLVNKEYKRNDMGWWGLPAHTMAWKAILAKTVLFPVQQTGEDMGWVGKICKLANVESHIDKVLYYYFADINKTETQGIKNLNHKFVR